MEEKIDKALKVLNDILKNLEYGEMTIKIKVHQGEVKEWEEIETKRKFRV